MTNATADLSPSRPHGSSLEQFEQIYLRNIDGILGYFARRCQNPQAVADLTAETFVLAAGDFPGFDPRKWSDRAWLLSIADQAFERRCKQEAQRATDLSADPPRDDHRQLEPHEAEELTQRIDAERERARMVARTAHLSAVERTAIEFVDLEGLSARDVATALGISRLALRYRLASARARLQSGRAAGGSIDPLLSR